MDELREALYELCKPFADGAEPDIAVLSKLVMAAEKPGAALRERPSFHGRVAYRLHERLAGSGCGPKEWLPGLEIDDRRRALDAAVSEIDAIVCREGLEVLAL